MPVRLKESRVITELSVGVFQTVGVRTDDDQFLLPTPQTWLFIFILRIETSPKRRNVYNFVLSCAIV